MSMKTTNKGIKNFSKEEKLAILDEGKRNGIKVTLAKYSFFPATYYYWRKKFNVYGEEGLTWINQNIFEMHVIPEQF